MLVIKVIRVIGYCRSGGCGTVASDYMETSFSKLCSTAKTVVLLGDFTNRIINLWNNLPVNVVSAAQFRCLKIVSLSLI